MKKLLALLIVFLIPTTNAFFIRSDMSLKAEEPSPLPLNKKVVVEANLTFSWGFGAIIPLPLTIYVEAKDVPEWLSVSINPSQITLSPFGLFGGEESKTLQIYLQANDEVDAFTPYTITIHAYTNGSFLIRGSEALAKLTVMEDFVDNGLYIEMPSAVNMRVGETDTITLNITNKCNAPIYLEVYFENTTGFNLSSRGKISIASKATESLTIDVKAEKVAESRAILKFVYYPVADSTRKNQVERMLLLSSRAKPGGGGAIAIGLVIIIIGIIAYIIWKKKF